MSRRLGTRIDPSSPLELVTLESSTQLPHLPHLQYSSHWLQPQIPHLPGQAQGRTTAVVQLAVLPSFAYFDFSISTEQSPSRSKFQRRLGSRISVWIHFSCLTCTMYRAVERQVSEGTVGMGTRTRGRGRSAQVGSHRAIPRRGLRS